MLSLKINSGAVFEDKSSDLLKTIQLLNITYFEDLSEQTQKVPSGPPMPCG